MLNFLEAHSLSILLFTPALAALAVMLLPARRIKLLRWFALAASLLPLGLSVYLWLRFDPALDPRLAFQFEEWLPWFPAIGSSYHLGLDGLSLPMVALTCLLTPLAILASFKIETHLRGYLALFLLLETGILGVFMALDLLLFFVFWEIGLVPMYFLINQWGGANRNYASLKFIIFTMGGSLGLLLAIQLIGLNAGSFDMLNLFRNFGSLDLSVFGLTSAAVKTIAFWAFVIAFAVKVPVWPFHTWLPDAHTEAPTAGSMILAGVLLKLGAYGFLRLVLPLFPQESARFAPALAALAAAAIIFGALAAAGQKDLKKLVAYSSVNHMGFVMLGVAAVASAVGGDAAAVQSSRIAASGAVLQMVNHGLSSAGMFFLVGVLYDRAHTRQLDEFGGLYALLPAYGTVFIFVSMASLGLPGLNGFISELLVVVGAWPLLSAYVAAAMIGLIFTGTYILKGIRQVLHGPLNLRWRGVLTEMSAREWAVILPLMALMLLLGIWPSWLLDLINRAVMFWF